MKLADKLKGKGAGYILLIIGTVLSLAATIRYLVFGIVSETFVQGIFVLLLISFLIGVATLFYNGYLDDFLPAVITVLLTAGLMLFARDSVDDITAFFVGMGDFFGNADNVGPRMIVAVLVFVDIIVTVVASFGKKLKKEDE